MAALVNSCGLSHLCNNLQILVQVSAVTDHVGVQNDGSNAADFDDDDGGGLVSQNLLTILHIWVKYEFYERLHGRHGWTLNHP